MLLLGHHGAPGLAVAFHPTQPALLSAAGQNLVAWDLRSSDVLAEWAGLPGVGPARGEVRSAEFFADGSAVVLVGSAGFVDVRRWPDGAVLQRHDPAAAGAVQGDPGPELLYGTNPRQLSLPAYRHDARLALGGYGQSPLDGQHRVLLWRVDSPPTRRHLWGHADRLTGLALSPDGRLAASAGRDGTVRVGTTATGAVSQTWHPGPRPLGPVHFATNALLLAAVGPTVVGFDLTLGKPRFAVSGHEGAVTAFALSRDGRVLASAASDGSLGLAALAATAGEAAVTRYDFRAAPGAEQCVAVAPDGVTAATIDARGCVRLWDVEV